LPESAIPRFIYGVGNSMPWRYSEIEGLDLPEQINWFIERSFLGDFPVLDGGFDLEQGLEKISSLGKGIVKDIQERFKQPFRYGGSVEKMNRRIESSREKSPVKIYLSGMFGYLGARDFLD
jgi:hypothetical protein